MGKKLIIAKEYGRLDVVSEPYRKYTNPTSSQKTTYVKAVCKCGKTDEYVVRDLKRGTTKSCGCLRGEMSGSRTRTHGFTSSNGTDFDIYRVWLGMKKRCYDKKQSCYKHYGGRGIRVCDEWLESPIVFHKWAIENGYKKGLFLDKIDNNENYSPENCRFITPTESALNRRFIKLSLEKANKIRELHFVEKKTFVAIAKIYDVSETTISYIVKNKIWKNP